MRPRRGRSASTPTAAVRLVVPDPDELVAGLDRVQSILESSVRSLVRRTDRLDRLGERLRRAPVLLLERRRAALDVAAARDSGPSRRGPPSPVATRSCVHTARVLREASTVSSGDAIDVELARGRLAARVDELRT